MGPCRALWSSSYSAQTLPNLDDREVAHAGNSDVEFIHALPPGHSTDTVTGSCLTLLQLSLSIASMDVSAPKRRKGELSLAGLPQPKRIKKEEPDSPPPIPQRQLVTSGSRRYADVPADCRKALPGFKRAREAWSKKEAEVLKAMGLKPVRTFIRCVSMLDRL